MTIEIEARVRRANLLTRDDQLEQMFDNDVSGRLLRDIDAKKEGRMSETTDRPQSAAVEETRGYEQPAATQPPARRRGLAWALAAFIGVLAVGAVLALVAREPEPMADTPVEIAEAFLAALSAHDTDTVVSMLAEGATHDHDSIEILRGEIELQGVLDRRYEFAPCVGDPSTSFRCDYEFSTAVSRAIGAEPYGESYLLLTVSDGMISRWNQHEDDSRWRADALPAFASWMEENHPEDDLEDLYFHYFGPETIAFWERYLPEFLASVESSG